MNMMSTSTASDSMRTIHALLSRPESLQRLSVAKDIVGIFGVRLGSFECLYSLLERGAGKGTLCPRILGGVSTGYSFDRSANPPSISAHFVTKELNQSAMNAARNLSGTDVEVFIHNLKPDLLVPKFKGTQWDAWGTGDPTAPKEKILAERQEKTRGLTATILQELEKHCSLDQFKNVLFLGCGDGCDVETYLSYVQQRTFRAKITAFDQSAFALETAKKRIAQRFSPSAVDFCRLEFSDVPSLASKGPFDLVIGVGIFDRETLKFDEGLRLGSYVRLLMTRNGILTASAYGYELFEAQHYKALGFQVLQSAVPSRLFTSEYPCLYIVKNSDAPISQADDLAAARSHRIWGA